MRCNAREYWGDKCLKVVRAQVLHLRNTPCPLPVHTPTPLLPHFLPTPAGHLVAGALAGAASRTATAPLETLRLAVMTGSLEASDLMQGAAVLMARGGGWKALFRGNAVNVMRCGGRCSSGATRWGGGRMLRGNAFSVMSLGRRDGPQGPCGQQNRLHCCCFWTSLLISSRTILPPAPPFPLRLRSAPSKALDFFAFDTFKKLLGDTGGYAQTFAAAGLAGEGAGVWGRGKRGAGRGLSETVLRRG